MFAKVFRTILDGSLGTDHEARHGFMDLLTLANRDGEVDMTPEAIAAVTNVPVERVRAVLERLSSPDPKSRNPNAEGRRIVPIDEGRDWGWRIVNYHHYRGIHDQRERTAYFREYRRTERARKAAGNLSSPAFTSVHDIAEAEAEAEAEQEEKQLLPRRKELEEPARSARRGRGRSDQDEREAQQ